METQCNNFIFLNVASISSFAAGRRQHKLIQNIFFYYYPVLEECLPAIKRPQTEECCVTGCKYYLWYCLPAINPLQRLCCRRLVCVRHCFSAVWRGFISCRCRITAVSVNRCVILMGEDACVLLNAEYSLPWTKAVK